jgi:hypothetical protein
MGRTHLFSTGCVALHTVSSDKLIGNIYVCEEKSKRVIALLKARAEINCTAFHSLPFHYVLFRIFGKRITIIHLPLDVT